MLLHTNIGLARWLVVLAYVGLRGVDKIDAARQVALKLLHVERLFPEVSPKDKPCGVGLIVDVSPNMVGEDQRRLDHAVAVPGRIRADGVGAVIGLQVGGGGEVYGVECPLAIGEVGIPLVPASAKVVDLLGRLRLRLFGAGREALQKAKPA